ncbi:2,3-dimethylmalate dehydratase large subunit [Clostridioides difficile]|nr:2,3-dimethylmalate dehydratase large subunit [Clostridioides difficile]
MGMTMTQKILAKHAKLNEVKKGQLIEADLDVVLGNDITLSLIHISEPTRLGMISYAVFCLKKKKNLRRIYGSPYT